jgi:hypothetical protein
MTNQALLGSSGSGNRAWIRTQKAGLGCISVAEGLPRVREALGLIPSTKKILIQGVSL